MHGQPTIKILLMLFWSHKPTNIQVSNIKFCCIICRLLLSLEIFLSLVQIWAVVLVTYWWFKISQCTSLTPRTISISKFTVIFILLLLLLLLLSSSSSSSSSSSFMQDVYTYIPETNHVPGEHCVAATLVLLFMVRISLAPVLTPLYLYVSTFRSMCAVPNMAVFCNSLTS